MWGPVLTGNALIVEVTSTIDNYCILVSVKNIAFGAI